MTSSKRLTRHEIQEPDQFLVTMERLGRYVREHRAQVIGGVVVLGLVTAAAAGTVWWLKGRDRRAAEALAALVETAERPVAGAAAASPDDTRKPFPDAAARDNAILEQADAFLKDHAGAPTARAALLLKAEALLHRGRAKDAAEAYAQAGAASPRDALGAAAAFGRATALAESGSLDQAVDELSRLAAASNPVVPKDLALERAAGLRARAGQNEQAIELYRRLLTEVADSPLAGQARQKLVELGGTPPAEAPAAVPAP